MGAYEEEGRAMNHLKAGIITTDRIVTVSPGASLVASCLRPSSAAASRTHWQRLA
jgi:glycogen synthase